jgi:hypothetical protein
MIDSYLFVTQVKAVQRETVLLDKVRAVAAVLVRVLDIAVVSNSKPWNKAADGKAATPKRAIHP